MEAVLANREGRALLGQRPAATPSEDSVPAVGGGPLQRWTAQQEDGSRRLK